MQLSRVVPCFSASFSSSWRPPEKENTDNIPIQMMVKDSWFLMLMNAPFTGQRCPPPRGTHARSLGVMEARTTHLEVVVFVRVGPQEIFGALNVIGQLSLRQLRSKLLQHLGCGFHRHSKVLYGLREKSLVSPPAAKLKLRQAGSDPPYGGVSTGCGSTPGFLPVPRSAGLCPRTRGGPTESSASLSATQVPAVTLRLAQPAFPTWLIVETSEAASLKGSGSQSRQESCMFTCDELPSLSEEDCSRLLPEMEGLG